MEIRLNQWQVLKLKTFVKKIPYDYRGYKSLPNRLYVYIKVLPFYLFYYIIHIRAFSNS